MASYSFGYLVMLATVLLFINPNEVRAKRTLRLYKLEKVVEKKEDLQSHLRIAEFEEGVLKVSGDLKQHVTIDNDWTIHFTISRADGHDEEYEEILDLDDLGVCDVMKTYYKEFLYEEIKEYSNAPHPNNCPLPPEHYKLEDYPMDVHLFKKLLIPGYYRIVSRLLHNDHIKLEYMAELEMKD